MTSLQCVYRYMLVPEALWSHKARRHLHQLSSPRDSGILWDLSTLEVPATFDHQSVSEAQRGGDMYVCGAYSSALKLHSAPSHNL